VEAACAKNARAVLCWGPGDWHPYRSSGCGFEIPLSAAVSFKLDGAQINTVLRGIVTRERPLLRIYTIRSMYSNALSYLSPKVTVRSSPIHGRGLFAAENLRPGEIVCVKGGHIFNRATLDKVAAILGPAEIQVADDLFIGPIRAEEREGGMIFSNHSCDPNICVQGQIVFVALRQIPAGEELTHDWATTDDDTLACRCGAASCRGTITGKDWQQEDLQRKYRGLFSWFLQQKIDALGGE
jgi:hypothetical protein